MITYEGLPPSAQKAYKFTNNIRKITMFVGWILTIIVIIFSNTLGDDGISLSLYDIILSLYLGMLVGSAFLFFIHLEFLFKKIINIFGIIGILGCCLLVSFFFAVGPIFLIIDTILFCLKKPLVYPFENKCFLNSKQAQAEVIAKAMMELHSSQNNETTIANLQNLKELVEQGLITEDEFNSKKA